MALRLEVLAASNRQPAWVDAGFDEYAGRLRGRAVLGLKVVPLARRPDTSGRAVADEGRRLLAAAPKDARLVALDERGTAWSTRTLATRLDDWITDAVPVALLIGGPDGLSSECLERAHATWSLSALTLPHGLARIVVAEALYRALSLLEGHPYHRA